MGCGRGCANSPVSSSGWRKKYLNVTYQCTSKVLFLNGIGLNYATENSISRFILFKAEFFLCREFIKTKVMLK